MNRPATYRRKSWHKKAPLRHARNTGLQIASTQLAMMAGCSSLVPFVYHELAIGAVMKFRAR